MPRAANNEAHCSGVIRPHDTNAVGKLPVLLCLTGDTKQLVHTGPSESLFGILGLSERTHK